jgi:hypothetical protein
VFIVLYPPFDRSLEAHLNAHVILGKTKRGKEEILIQSITPWPDRQKRIVEEYESAALFLNASPDWLQKLTLEAIQDTLIAEHERERQRLARRKRFYPSFSGHGAHGVDAWD